MIGAEVKTIGEIITEIQMSRTVFNGSFLVVEGDDDVRFWKTRPVDPGICQLVNAGGKGKAVGSVLEAEKLSLKGILVVVDDDCDSLLGVKVPSPCIIRTETHDLETLMLKSRAFDKVLAEKGDDNKVSAFEQKEGKIAREALISRALLFGQLRYLNTVNNWKVDFNNLHPECFADSNSWAFDREEIISEFLSQLQGISREDLENRLASLPSVADVWLILHGHDCLRVLAIGFRNVLGKQRSYKDLGGDLRLAFDDGLFQATQLYRNIKKWQDNNPPYRIV